MLVEAILALWLAYTAILPVNSSVPVDCERSYRSADNIGVGVNFHLNEGPGGSDWFHRARILIHVYGQQPMRIKAA
jgi:hypothetical protein